MINTKGFSNQIINFILAIFLTFSFVYALTNSLQFTLSRGLIFLFVSISVLICILVFYNKRTLIISLSTIGVLLIGGAIFLIATDMFYSYLYDFEIFVYWLINFMQGFVANDAFYELVTTLFISFAVSIFVYFITIKHFRFLVMLCAGIALFTIQWIFNYFTSYMALYVFLFIIIISYFRYIFIKNSSRGLNRFISISTFTCWIIPLTALILIIVCMLPPSNKPLEWGWLDKKINAVYNYFNSSFVTFKSSDYFSISNSGFGGSSVLGGKVKLDKTVVLRVDSPRRVYLKGASCDYYSGTSWNKTNTDSVPFNDSKNSINTCYANLIDYLSFGKEKNNTIETYFFRDKIKISFANLHSKPLFLPLNAIKVTLPKNSSSELTVDTDGILKSKKVFGKGSTYTVEALFGKYNDKTFQNLLRQSTKGFYAQNPNDFAVRAIRNNNHSFYNDDYVKWDDIKNQYVLHTQKLIDTNSDFIINSYYNSLNELYSKYLQLPVSLPERVKNLSASITASNSTNYDKVKSIEKYLAKKYPYTLNPKPTPLNRDFVDYFLFDLKEGYCTYFATAMTIMVRSIGLPARYVEGYILPPKPKTGKTYEVTNQQAHAWVEVYFEGVGWLPFEPTSAFSASFYNNPEYNGTLSPEFSRDMSYYQYLDLLRRYGHSGAPNNYQTSIKDNIVTGSSKLLFIIFLIISLIILGTLILIIINIIKLLSKLRRLNSMDPRTSILSYYQYYVRILCYAGIITEPGETPGEYSIRVDKYLNFGKTNNFQEVANRFILARYSPTGLEHNDKILVSSFYNQIELKIKENLKIPKYLVSKYLLGRFK